MLTTLDIRNYQSHQSTMIQFDKGMNVITGISDSGKSAIFRALIWALKNRPSGDAFRCWSSKPSDTIEVGLEFDNGWFTKFRDTKNKYETEEGFYEALRSDVPEPVQKIANIADYNIQTQFQPYFLLQDSPGERAKRLNELAGLDIIDRIFKKLNAKITNTKQDIIRTSVDIKTFEGHLEEMKYLDSAELLITKLCQTIDKHEKTKERAGSVRLSIEKLSELDTKIEQQSRILHFEKEYLRVKDANHTNDLKKLNRDHIQDLTSKLSTIREELDNENDFLAVEKPYKAIMKKLDAILDATGKRNGLHEGVGNAEYLSEQIDYVAKNIPALEQLYTDTLKAAGICPLCKQSTKEIPNETGRSNTTTRDNIKTTLIKRLLRTNES